MRFAGFLGGQAVALGLTLCLSIYGAQAAESTEAPGDDLGADAGTHAGTDAGGFWSDFDVTLGALVGTGPDYEGSDSYDFVALPVVNVTYRDTLFLRTNTLGATFSPIENLSFGPLMSYGFGRDEDDNDDLEGLGDVDSAVLVGGFASYEISRFELSVNVLHAVTGDHDGTVVAPSVSYGQKVTSALSVEVEVGATWASDDYMETFFGIDAVQAANSRLRRFDAEAGFKDIGLSFGANYRLSEGWALLGKVGYTRLLGDAADSPLVDDVGSPNQFHVMTGLTYSF